MRPHSTATFTISLKLAVGILDSSGREWLHNGKAHHRKIVELNLAYSADLVVVDASKILIDKNLTPEKAASPGIIIASGNRVAADSISVALMRLHGADRVSEKPVHEHEQIKFSDELGLGSSRLQNIDVKTLNLIDDDRFDELISGIEKELECC